MNMLNIIQNINDNSEIIGTGTFGKVYKTIIKKNKWILCNKRIWLSKKRKKCNIKRNRNNEKNEYRE